MKHTFYFTIILAFAFLNIGKTQKTYIPDDNFEMELVNLGYDILPLNDSVPTTNIQNLSSLTMINKGISDLTGIEDFSSLEILKLDQNNLTLLDLTSNGSLTTVWCNNNDLNSINLPLAGNLEEIRVNNNALTTIDVTGQSALSVLTMYNNLMTQIDVSQNTNLEVLITYSMDLDEVNVAQNPLLRQLHCGNTNLDTLDVSLNPLLEILFCYSNNLTELDLSNNPLLTDLYSYRNPLSELDLTQNTLLDKLRCSNNTLDELNLSQNSSLTEITASNNTFDSLELSNNPLLTELSLIGNSLLTHLVFNNTRTLEKVAISGSLLTNIDLSADTNLTSIAITQNTNLESLNVQNGHNTSVTNFTAILNPDLFCIQVDDTTYSNSNWTSIDMQTSFNGDCIALALPIEHILFHLSSDVSGEVNLNWVTELEGILNFEVYRSWDGTNWDLISTVPANTNSDHFSYSIKDFPIAEKAIYYRLKMINKDGSHIHSAIEVIKVKLNKKSTVYPIPASDVITINSNFKYEYEIQVIDQFGKVILNTHSNTQTITLEISDLPSGSYYVRLLAEDGVEVLNFLK